MKKENTLSSRGQSMLIGSPREDLDLYFKALENLYDPAKNPDGALPMNMAENRLCWNMLQKRLETVTHKNHIPDWVPSYTSTLGAPEFRESVSSFMAAFLTKCPINPDHVACSAGAAGVIEVTTLVLADPGDVAVFPAPAYPVYKDDIGNVADMERYNLQTHTDLEELEGGPLVNIELLKDAFEEIAGKGKRFRVLVLTQPDNPTGQIYGEESLEVIAKWCIESKVHLVVNEIYGLSMLNDPDDESSFQSFATVMQKLNSDYLHLWYAFSKDFGISGFRMGILYSLNTDLMDAYSKANIGHMASNYVQWILSEVLNDHHFLRQYIKVNQGLLTEAHHLVMGTLKKLNVTFVAPKGGLFIWADFSVHLERSDEASGRKFWLDLFRETGILLTPGTGFGHRGHGRFRLICTFLPMTHLKVAMERLEKYLSIKSL